MPENQVVFEIKNPGTHIVKFGKEPDVIECSGLSLAGNITSPLEFFKKRHPFKLGFDRVDVKDEDCHIMVNEEEGSITLKVQDNSPLMQMVKGALKPHYAQGIFPINTDKEIDLLSFQKLVRANRFWFADQDKQSKLLLSLQNLKGKVSRDFENTDDNKGNTTNINNFATKIEGIELNFDLKMPIYAGTTARVFKVEVYINATSSNLMYQLVSPELLELKETVKAEELAKALGEEMPKLFTVIYC